MADSFRAPRSATPSSPKAPPAGKAEAVNGNNLFALDLYGRLRSREGNLFLSPASISAALAMTYAGARGETAEQMASTLHFTLGQERLHPALGALLHDLEADGKKHGYQLSLVVGRDAKIGGSRAHTTGGPRTHCRRHYPPTSE